MVFSGMSRTAVIAAAVLSVGCSSNPRAHMPAAAPAPACTAAGHPGPASAARSTRSPPCWRPPPGTSRTANASWPWDT